MTEIRIRLPLPSPRLSPNARAHWRSKARDVKSYRRAAAFYGRLALEESGDPGAWTTADVGATFYHPTRRLRDADNLLASLKAAFDGFADAGIVSNDRALTHLPVLQLLDRNDPRVEIRIRRTDA